MFHSTSEKKHRTHSVFRGFAERELCRRTNGHLVVIAGAFVGVLGRDKSARRKCSTCDVAKNQERVFLLLARSIIATELFLTGFAVVYTRHHITTSHSGARELSQHEKHISRTSRDVESLISFATLRNDLFLGLNGE